MYFWFQKKTMKLIHSDQEVPVFKVTLSKASFTQLYNDHLKSEEKSDLTIQYRKMLYFLKKKKGAFSNYKFSKKITGLCHICNHDKKWMTKYYTNQEILKFKSKYESHRSQKDSHDLALKQLKVDSVFGDFFITFDFKRNPVIGSYGTETSKQFFKRFEITCLGCEIEYKNEKGEWIKKYDICLSDDIKHNGDNTIAWMENFLVNRMESVFGVKPKRLYLCFDTGKHFKCNQVIDYLRGYAQEVPFELYYVSYVPYHGKTTLDQCFSVVGVVFNGKADIRTVSDAVTIGNERFSGFDKANLEYNNKNPNKRQKKNTQCCVSQIQSNSKRKK